MISCVGLALTVPATAQQSDGAFAGGLSNTTYSGSINPGYVDGSLSRVEYRQRYLDALNQLCSSSRRRDLQRCEQIWHVINSAYAQLQARRAAEAAKP